MKKIIGYTRVSTEEQVREGISLEGQASDISKYVELYYPGNDIKFITDEGRSAKNLNRNGIKDILSTLDDIDILIVWKLDRLSRNLKDAISLLNQLIKSGVEVISVREKIDYNSATGKAFVHIILLFAELERDNIIERTKMGLLQKARNGEYPYGRPPFGFKKEKGKLVMSEESHIVKDIIDLLNRKKKQSEIIDHCYNKYGSKRTMWAKRIRLILSNSIYYGLFICQEEEFYNIVLEPYIQTKIDYSTKRERYDYFSVDVHCDKCNTVLRKESSINCMKKVYTYKYCKNCNKRIRDSLIEKQYNNVTESFTKRKLENITHIRYDFDNKELRLIFK